MKIVLLRHGIAIDREDPRCPSEAERGLTERGRRRTREAARGLLALGVSPDRVFASPWLRAVETARIAMKALRVSEDALDLSDKLLPEAPPESFARTLDGLGVGAVLVVGHAPHLDRLLAHLVGAPGELTRLRKAGAARVDRASDGATVLSWMFRARDLRALGRCA